MPVYSTSPEEGVGRAWKYYAGGAGLIDLTTVSGKPKRCARRIIFLAAGAVAHLKDSGGNDEPLAAVLAGMVFDADVSAVDSAVAMIVFW
jgi:hypothetical protein